MEQNEEENLTGKLQFFYHLMNEEIMDWEEKLLLAGTEERRKLTEEFINTGAYLRGRYHELFSKHIFDEKSKAFERNR